MAGCRRTRPIATRWGCAPRRKGRHSCRAWTASQTPEELLLSALDELTAELGYQPFASHGIAKRAGMNKPDSSRWETKVMADKGYCTSSSKGYTRIA